MELDVTYKRQMHKSYMCIKAEYLDEVQRRLPEEIMLEKYKVPGLLRVQKIQENGVLRYYYEISGCQQFSDYMAGRKIGKEQLKSILFALQELCEALPQYLLREEGIWLQEEFVYVHLSDERLYFTYLPFQSSSLAEGFRRWMERILRQVDHQERASAEFAYDVYQRTLKEDICIRDLLKDTLGDTCKNEEQPKELRQNTESTFKREVQEGRTKKIEGVTEQGTERRAEEEEGESSLSASGRKQAWTKKGLLEQKIENVKHHFQKIIEETEGYHLYRFLGKREEKCDYRAVFHPKEVEKEEKQRQHPTVYLGKDVQEVSGRLIYCGSGGQQDFSLGQEPFFIGKSQEQADGKIDGEGISRLHAKIIKKDGEYYLEDLNSTNGTFLNEELLEYHQPRRLQKNDRIRFAGEEYVFC